MKVIRILFKLFCQQLILFTPTPQHPTLTDRPGQLYIHWRLGWLKFQFLKPFWRIKHQLGLGPRVIAGKRVSLMGSISLQGPGTVFFGNDIMIDGHLTPFTHDNMAVISFGDRCFLNGTRLGCARSISVGADCILADARIMDTDFHAISGDRWDRKNEVAFSPIEIGDRVWIAAGSAVLKGVHIGNGSMIGFGSVVTQSIPENVLAAGNPAVVLKNLKN